MKGLQRMPEATPAAETEQTVSGDLNSTPMSGVDTNVPPTGPYRRTTRLNRPSGTNTVTPKDFVGTTPQIGGVLGLRSENVSKKLNYDNFCEKLGIYVMNKLKSGETVVVVTKNYDADVINIFKTKHKPSELTAEEKKSTVDLNIHREEIKDYLKELKILKSNLKKYTVWYIGIALMVFRQC